MARQLAKSLEYTDFRNFTSVIEKAKEAWKNSGQPVNDHLVEFNEVVAVGSGATHTYPSYKSATMIVKFYEQKTWQCKNITIFAVWT